MAASPEPFLTYLTVFRSRLGLANLVLDVTPLGHQPERALRRRIRQVLDRRVELDVGDSVNYAVFEYLSAKKIVGETLRSSGRYRGISLASQEGGGFWKAESAEVGPVTRLPVYQTDIWFAHPDMPSTIGVPTPDNAGEVIDFAFQLGILERMKNSWTSTGHLVAGLRRLSVEPLPDPSNPFLLGAESVALLRTLLERDGLVLRELLRFLVGRGPIVRRDEVAEALPSIAGSALEAAKDLRVPAQKLAVGHRLVSKLSETDPSGNARAPGVREHRSSPRLEWLTDLGYLSKDGLAKNSFEYQVTSEVEPFLASLDAAIAARGDWCLTAALNAWPENGKWESFRRGLMYGLLDERVALGRAYSVLRRPIGPAPLRDVAFITGMLCRDLSADEVVARVVELTRETPGASLSGGRMTRSPENIFMSDESLRVLGVK